jgi:hypothetical protein
VSDWGDLDRELDAWHGLGRPATLWWRDDDATRVTPELERLLAISAAQSTPIALAVIPRDVDPALAQRLAGHPLASVLQHGWSHDNHAGDGDRQQEFVPHRPRSEMIAELSQGWQRLQAFPRALPVMVAPWNRIDESLLPMLTEAGLSAVSTLGPRKSAWAAAGVRRTNIHVDIVDWDGSRGFVGLDRALEQIVGHLRDKREGRADADEPTGLMTHHLFHDEGCWWFVDELLRRSRRHGAVRWLAAREAFSA